MISAEQINQALYEETDKRRTIYPCYNLRARSLGHPCTRYLVYSITNWQDQEKPDVGLQHIFDLGSYVEGYVIQKIKDAGYEVITPVDKAWKIDTPLIHGREDLRIKDKETGELYPVEVKSLSPFVWDKLNSVDDFYNSKHAHVRAYPGQLMCYMWKFEKDKGFFALLNKVTGEIKIIEVPFDWNKANDLFEKGKLVYKHIEDKTLPDPIDDESVCEHCPFAHICGHISREGAEIETDGYLEGLLDEKATLKPSYSRYNEIGDLVKDHIGTRPKVIAGHYIVERKVTTKVNPDGSIKETARLKITDLGSDSNTQKSD